MEEAVAFALLSPLFRLAFASLSPHLHRPRLKLTYNSIGGGGGGKVEGMAAEGVALPHLHPTHNYWPSKPFLGRKGFGRRGI